MRFEVIKITNDPDSHGEQDNHRFPELVDYVQDEQEIFIVAKNGQWWYADEFFYQVEIPAFMGPLINGVGENKLGCWDEIFSRFQS